jgi:hypothetical protein
MDGGGVLFAVPEDGCNVPSLSCWMDPRVTKQHIFAFFLLLSCFSLLSSPLTVSAN